MRNFVFPRLTSIIALLTILIYSTAPVSLARAQPWSAAPLSVAGEMAALDSGGDNVCALTNGGAVKCWGRNNLGQLGDSTQVDRSTPEGVLGLTTGITAITAGMSHGCAVTGAGNVKCWGWNLNGQLGNGTTSASSSLPVFVKNSSGSSNLAAITAVSAGQDFGCALTTGGGVKCWGVNTSGQLGDNSTNERHLPVDVSGLSSGIKKIVAGSEHACALTTGGAVKCWGENLSGQLGDGSNTDRHTPANVTGLSSGVIALAAGGSHTCAVMNDGSVLCWGANQSGQLGDGSNDNHNTPVAVSGLTSGYKDVTAGGTHSCGLSETGSVKCWGYNSYGQLGDGTNNDSSVPVDVVGLTNIVSLSAGWSHTCTVGDDGGIQCWGYNAYGQLGDCTRTNRSEPVVLSKPGIYLPFSSRN